MQLEKEQHKKPWRPDRPTSKGAIAYHKAVSKAQYYIDVLEELMKIVSPKIKEGDIVVDFGAGTGVSASRLLANLKVNIKLWLVDNSPAWLGKAYEIFSSNSNVEFFILEKKDNGYSNLADTVGKGLVDHVISANTVHLVPDLEETFKGIADALKEGGTFTFQSGNIVRSDRPNGALMVDNTVIRVHDIALEIVRTDPRFKAYKDHLDMQIKINEAQRKLIFPNPRPIEVYLHALKKANFEYQEPYYKLFRITYNEWLEFLRVRRLQAGILPEIGGNNPTPKEEIDRDTLITLATKKLFQELESKNPLADAHSFTIDIVYVTAKKVKNKFYNQNKLMLTGKVALVTGASRGIGKAIAIELAKNGANVVVNYNKNEKEAEQVLEEIKKIGVDGVIVKADVSSFDECAAMIEVIKKRFGSIDILVNNAGILSDNTLKNMAKEDWDLVLRTNLNGIFNVTKNTISILRKYGRIISVSSIAGIYGNFGQTNYAASKSGIIGFTKSLAKELGKHGITVNAIAPGLIETEMTRNLPFIKKKLIPITPLGRAGTPEEVAYLVAFLASEKASYITGEVICIDGGLAF